MESVPLICVLVMLVTASVRADSSNTTCKERAMKYRDAVSETRVFNHGSPESWDYLIYCDVQPGYGYTFISTTSFASTDIVLYVHKDTHSDFKVVLLAVDGRQYETVISADLETKEIWIDYVTDVYNYGYNSYIRNKDMYPCIKASIRQTYGPMADLVYTANCKNVSSGDDCDITLQNTVEKVIWTFLFNRDNKTPLDDRDSRSKVSFLTKWEEHSRPASVSLPRNFFSFFEVTVPPCGGYMTSDDFPDIIGAAIGVKYVITCGTPEDIDHGHYTVTGDLYGDKVTYFCNDKYELKEQNDTLVCGKQGSWQGQVPTCKRILPRSCSDIAKMYSASRSGEYIIFNERDETDVVYCEFDGAATTTFLTSKMHYKSGGSLQFGPVNASEIVIRARYQDGRQVGSELKPTNANKDVPIALALQRNTMFVSMRSQVSEAVERHKEFIDVDVGYKLNGKDVVTTVTNCCYASSHRTFGMYAAMDPDRSLHLYRRIKEDPFDNPVAHKWLTDAADIAGERYMPPSYFNAFSIQVGASSYDSDDFKNITGVAIGFRTESEE